MGNPNIWEGSEALLGDQRFGGSGGNIWDQTYYWEIREVIGELQRIFGDREMIGEPKY